MPTIGPPTFADAEKPLRRRVALAYRAARNAGTAEHDAYLAAMAVYREAHPSNDPMGGSRRVAEMIASAINENPVWFWKDMPRAE